MGVPSLSDLPAPPPGRTGWPWTEAVEALPERMPDGRSWPRVSVVTPSYNQAAYLEATLRSVLLQGYPELEYFVVDGGSTDGSVSVLRRYDRWLAGWVSEPDEGQSHAINQGMAQTTGEILAWLNSDDLYEPNALAHAVRWLIERPTCGLVYGGGSCVDGDGRRISSCDWIRPFDRRLYLTSNFILQPAAFWRRWVWEQAGELDVSAHFAMDWEWFLRATAVTEPHFEPVELARWRIHPEIKTTAGGDRRRAEIAAVSRRHGGVWQPTYIVFLLDRVAWSLERRLGPGLARSVYRRATAPLRWLLKEKIWKDRYQA